jgi:hypothetical protein
MELVVDLSTKEVQVRDSDDLDRFAVRAVPAVPALRARSAGRTGRTGSQAAGDPGGDDLDALVSALNAHAAGTVVANGDALVSAPVIRQLAHEEAAARGRPLDAAWDARFASMLDYAGSKGWMADSETIRAHVDWGD